MSSRRFAESETIGSQLIRDTDLNACRVAWLKFAELPSSLVDDGTVGRRYICEEAFADSAFTLLRGIANEDLCLFAKSKKIYLLNGIDKVTK